MAGKPKPETDEEMIGGDEAAPEVANEAPEAAEEAVDDAAVAGVTYIVNGIRVDPDGNPIGG